MTRIIPFSRLRFTFPAMLSLAQGAYFFVAGVWPLLSINTFQAVTGPKTDLWLVKTVGLLIAVIGVTLALAGLRGRISAETITLAAGSAGALAAIDVLYVLAGRIAPIYLADAVVEAGFIGSWIVSRWRSRRTRRSQRIDFPVNRKEAAR